MSARAQAATQPEASAGDVQGDRWLAWATWPATVGLIAAVFAVRMAYLIWLSPYELVGDEAYYWECSRHLSACYYEKGPGLAWLIAACCRLLGDAEWAVRLPVALSSAAAAWVVGRLAMTVTGGDARAGFLAVLIFAAIPAFQANAQICTQDGPTILFWALLTASGLRLVRRWEQGSSRLTDWAVFSFLLGLACLFKQSALLFVPGAACYVVIRRRQLHLHPAVLWQALAGFIIFMATVTPMIVWNRQHGWPTLAHTLGHLGAPGGDHEAGRDARFSFAWSLSLIGAQLGAVGIPALAAMGIACVSAWRGRQTDPDGWPVRLWLICCAAPAIGFFVALSFVKPVIASWPFPSYVPLVALVAECGVARLSGAWRANNQFRLAGHTPPPRGRPTPFNKAFEITLIYGAAGWLILSFPNALALLPKIGPTVGKSVMKRISGHREHATRLQAYLDANHDAQGRPPLVIARYYMDAALDAFYLPGHPYVYNAGTVTGQRPTSYDYWPENNLSTPSLLGRSAVLDGSSPTRPWSEVLVFESITASGEGRTFVAKGYAGLRQR